jgi:imidazoleglycerol-phosphate dehydratase
VPLLACHPRLVIVRTLSKAHAAGWLSEWATPWPIPERIGFLDRVRDSYNANRLSQAGAIAALEDTVYYTELIARVQATRDRCWRASTEGFGWFAYPSEARNFIFVEPRNARGETGVAVARSLDEALRARRISVRSFPSRPLTAVLPPHQRRDGCGHGMPWTTSFSHGKSTLTDPLAEDCGDRHRVDPSRSMAPERRSIDTGIPFFDHMLTLFAKHGLFDLDLRCRGDVAVDYHHTVEDVGLVLGDAFRQASGDKRGIRRYGFFLLPMDEALARVVVDLSGRACLVSDAAVPNPFVRDFNLVLVKELARAFSNALACNLHVKLEYGGRPAPCGGGDLQGTGQGTGRGDPDRHSRVADHLPSTKGTL